VVAHAAWPQLQMMSGFPALASQNALQNLLSSAFRQLQDGCAQVSVVLFAINGLLQAASAFHANRQDLFCYKGLPQYRANR
jgi:hypothetical protein